MLQHSNSKSGRQWNSFRCLYHFGLLLFCVSLISCSSPPSDLKQIAEKVPEPGKEVLTQRASSADVVFGPQSTGQGVETKAKEENPNIVLGSGQFYSGLKHAPITEIKGDESSVTLNFVDAEIRDVLRAVMGETLRQNYVMDPQVRGKVTLKSSNPIPKDSVLFALEGALQLQNVALVENDGVFQVLPMDKANGRTASLRPYMPARGKSEGYSVRVVPLKYTTAKAMEEVLRPLAPDSGILRVDHSRNLFLLAGTQLEIDSMLDAIDVFDVDWLSSMSFAVLKPDNVDAKTLANELSIVFDDSESPIHGLVKLVPIPRINSLLVISKQPQYIGQVQDWVVRLDRSADLQTRKIYIYHVQHSRAEELSDSLNALLGGGTDVIIPALASIDQSAQPSTVPQPSGTRPSGDLRIVADKKNNALMILATRREYEVIEGVLRQLDITPDQVLIEAAIAEVDLNDDLAYGVQWFFQKSDSTFTLSDAASGAVASAFPGFSYSYLMDNMELAVNALASVTNVEMLSSPKLMVVNNQTATLQVGDQVPIATQSAVSVSDPDSPIVNNIEFRDTGVILEVTPRINKSGSVLLDVTQEVSDVADTITSGIDSPTIQTRRITSTVVVQDGETVALGGLIRDSETISDSGVPLLKDIPAIGEAFKSNDRNNRRTELLIFITPRIVSNVDETREVTNYLRSKLHKVDFLTLEKEPMQ